MSQSLSLTSLALLLGIILHSGCGSDKLVEQKVHYFDLKGFFEKEIARLDSLQPMVNKTVVLNKDRETRTTTDIDWATELDMFREADINRPAWIGKYQTDTLPGSGQTRIRFKAGDENLIVREVVITLEKDRQKISQIKIDKLTDNFLYRTAQELIYVPRQGFTINSRQKVVLSDENTFEVEVEFGR